MASRRRDKKEPESPRHLDSAKLYIGNLGERITERELEEAFQKFGKVRDCRVITETGSGRSKGFAFITFENPEDGATAQRETHDKLELDSKRLIVEIARGGEKQTRRHEPYDKRGPRRDYDRDRRGDYPDPKYSDHDRDKRDRPRGYPDLPPQWPPRDYPWYGREGAWPRDLPHFERDPLFRRDDRDAFRFPYPPIYPIPPVAPEDFYYHGRDRHRDYPEGRDREHRHRDWERDSRDRRDFPERDRPEGRDREHRNDKEWERDSRDRRDFISDKSSGEERRDGHDYTSRTSTSNNNPSTTSSSSNNREREYRKDERYENRDSSKETRTESHATDRTAHRENNGQERRRT